MTEKDYKKIQMLEAFKSAIEIADLITRAIQDRYVPKHKTDNNIQNRTQ